MLTNCLQNAWNIASGHQEERKRTQKQKSRMARTNKKEEKWMNCKAQDEGKVGQRSLNTRNRKETTYQKKGKMIEGKEEIM